MKTDIIDTHYVYNTQIFKVWKILMLFYGMILIYLTTIKGFDRLNEFEFIISILSKVFVTSGMLFFFANMFWSIKIGEILIKNDKLIIEQNESEKIIDLNLIDKVVFGKDRGDFYDLKISESDIVIKLSKSQLVKFKKHLTELNIEIKHRYFADRVSEWFRNKKYVAQHRV